MSGLPHRPDTGLPSLDAARFSAPVPFVHVRPFDGRFGGLLLDAFHMPPAPWETCVPPTRHHVLFMLMRTHTPTWRAEVAGRRLEFPARKGLAMLMPAGTDSRWASDRGGSTLHLHIAPALVEELAAEAELPPSAAALPLRTGFRDAETARLMRQMHKALALGGPAGALWTDQLAVLCTTALLRLAQRPPRGRAEPWRLDPAKLDAIRALVEDRIAAPPRLEELAAVAGLPRAAFLRAFRAGTGLTPARFVAERRAERAHLLLCRGIPAEEVARRCGFRDVPAMLRQCEAVSGSPLPVALRLAS